MIEKAYIEQLRRRYPDHLRAIIRGEPFQPILLRGGKHKPGNTTDLHQTIAAFLEFEKKADFPGWAIEWETWQSRKLGKQRWPVSITIQTEDDYLFILDKKKEVACFRQQLQQLVQWNQAITGWLETRPMTVLEWQSHWKGICAVTDYILLEEVSGHYTRTMPVPVNTKFIEEHQTAILSILRHLAPGRFMKESKDFELVVGLQQKPHLYPIRWLDPELAKKFTAGLDLLALPFSTIRKADWDVQEVWFVENEINLYLLPARKNALAIFSKGYALHNLKQVPFFSPANLFYWGDLDEDGYIMLQQFRSLYPHTKSVLMDERTVLFHQNEIEEVKYRFKRSIPDLMPEEFAGYRILLERNGRIEQEKLRQDYIKNYLDDFSFVKD